MELASFLVDVSHHVAFYILVLLGLLAIYAAGVVVYRLTLHPLAKYPGPFLAKATDIYLAYHAWKGDRHLEFNRCHEKYGRIVSRACSMDLLTL